MGWCEWYNGSAESCQLNQSIRQQEGRQVRLAAHDEENVNKDQSDQEGDHSQHCSTAAGGNDWRWCIHNAISEVLLSSDVLLSSNELPRPCLSGQLDLLVQNQIQTAE